MLGPPKAAMVHPETYLRLVTDEPVSGQKRQILFNTITLDNKVLPTDTVGLLCNKEIRAREPKQVKYKKDH